MRTGVTAILPGGHLDPRQTGEATIDEVLRLHRGWDRISHDLAVVRQLTQETVVMWRGRIVERGATAQVLDDPRDDYTRRLRASVPRPGWTPPRHASAIAARA